MQEKKGDKIVAKYLFSYVIQQFQKLHLIDKLICFMLGWMLRDGFRLGGSFLYGMLNFHIINYICNSQWDNILIRSSGNLKDFQGSCELVPKSKKYNVY